MNGIYSTENITIITLSNHDTERATMKGSSTVLGHERRSKEQERLHCHSQWHDLYQPKKVNFLFYAMAKSHPFRCRMFHIAYKCCIRPTKTQQHSPFSLLSSFLPQEKYLCSRLEQGRRRGPFIIMQSYKIKYSAGKRRKIHFYTVLSLKNRTEA